MNEAHKQPILNLALGRAYLSAHDPKLCTRTWQEVMEEMERHGLPRIRWRVRSRTGAGLGCLNLDSVAQKSRMQWLHDLKVRDDHFFDFAN